MKNIGHLIKKKRIALSMSQHDVGIEADIDIKYIGKIERGEVNVSINKLQSICNVLNITLSNFFKELNY